jgi:hypothetical protein
MADALASGASVLRDVGVQVPLRPHKKQFDKLSGLRSSVHGGRSARGDDAVVVGVDDGGSAVPQVEFSEDPADVGLDGHSGNA